MANTVIVFGGSGFLGRNLIARLEPRTERLISVSRAGAPVEGAGESYSIDRLSEIADLPSDAIVVNVAAHRYDVRRFDRAQSEILIANAALVEKVYAFCVDRGLREVRSASSVAVYPAGLEVLDDFAPIDLNKPPNPNETFYGWSKRWGEVIAGLYAEKYGIATQSFRLSNVYGPMDTTDIDSAHVLPAFVMRALEPAADFEIKGDPNVERDFIHVDDVCEVFEASFSRQGQTEAMNLSTGQNTRLTDLARTILRLMSEDRPLIVRPSAIQGVAARRSPNRRLRETFGKTVFVNLEDGLRQTLEWYRNELDRARR